MRIVDTSGEARGPEAEVRAVPAAELLMLTSLLVAEDAGREFDLDGDRIAELRALVSPAVASDLHQLAGTNDKQLLNLVRRAVASEPPHEPDALIGALGAASAEEIALDLLWVQERGNVEEADAVRALEGDPDARAALLASLKGKAAASAARILDLGPERIRELVLGVVRGLSEDVWPAVRDEAIDAIERDAQAKQALLEEHPTLRAIEAATNGYRLPTDPELREVVLIPSYVFRPWLLSLDLDAGRQVLVYPVADESIDLDPDRPSPQLVRLVKALGDEGRLRLLRRLGATDLSLAEAAETLGVSKPTAHHHMALLRQAGLISVSPRGRESCYSLRSEPSRYAEQLLGRYLDV